MKRCPGPTVGNSPRLGEELCRSPFKGRPADSAQRQRLGVALRVALLRSSICPREPQSSLFSSSLTELQQMHRERHEICFELQKGTFCVDFGGPAEESDGVPEIDLKKPVYLQFNGILPFP